MKYCVIKNTTTLIEGSDETDEIMLGNALNCEEKYTSDQVEILTEEEYQARLSNFPVKTQAPTLEERLASTEAMITKLMGV